jgi:hypothetical protein
VTAGTALFGALRKLASKTDALDHMSPLPEPVKTRGIRQVLTTVGEVRSAVMQVTGVATRTLSILTHDLEPDVYDHDDFLETLKKFILARTFARVRVLILEPARVVLSASRFVAMGRRLNSYIEFRRVLPELSGHPEAFFIADEQALVYRARAESWEGMSDTYEPAVARMYLSKFESLWNACETEPEVRQLQI